jgi:hypothetical protein
LRRDGVEFAGEDVGWHIVVEGSMGADECDRMLAQVCQQIAAAAGEPCEWLQIT